MHNFLGVIGGLGPEASAYFYKLLIERTHVLNDQEHLDMVILNHASMPDRTGYILGESEDNPLPYLVKDVRLLESLGAKAIVIICNTAHYFYPDLVCKTTVPIFNLIEDTVIYIKEERFKRVMILGTSGTLKSHLYQDSCKRHGVDFIVPDDEKEKTLMSIIYDYVKCGRDVPKSMWESLVEGVDVEGFILGCTELSILKDEFNLGSEFINPLEIEVDRIIEFFGKEKKV